MLHSDSHSYEEKKNRLENGKWLDFYKKPPTSPAPERKAAFLPLVERFEFAVAYIAEKQEFIFVICIRFCFFIVAAFGFCLRWQQLLVLLLDDVFTGKIRKFNRVELNHRIRQMERNIILEIGCTSSSRSPFSMISRDTSTVRKFYFPLEKNGSIELRKNIMVRFRDKKRVGKHFSFFIFSRIPRTQFSSPMFIKV